MYIHHLFQLSEPAEPHNKSCFEKCICPEEEDDNSINDEIRNDSGHSSTDQVNLNSLILNFDSMI